MIALLVLHLIMRLTYPRVARQVHGKSHTKVENTVQYHYLKGK